MSLYHSVTGSITYNTTGNPTIVNGIASGFSENDGINTSSVLSAPNGTPFEFEFDFTTWVENPGVNQWLLHCQSAEAGVGAWMQVWALTDRKFRCTYHLTDQTSDYVTTDYVVENSTSYKLKVSYDGTDISIYLYAADGTLLDSASKTPADSIFMNASASGQTRIGYYSNGFQGSIDLNKTYIKLNNAAWFGVCPVEVKYIDYGTATSYTVTGSPVIEAGIASGFSNRTNYLRVPQLSFTEDDNLELGMKFYLNTNDGTSGNAPTFFYGEKGAYYPFYISTVQSSASTRVLRWNPVVGDNTYVMVAESAADILDKWVYLKAHRIKQSSNYRYILSYSVDGGDTYTTAIDQVLSVSASGSEVGFLGIGGLNRSYSADSKAPCISQIDLNETYIKINGKLAFFRPATRYLVKDNKLVWGAQDLYLDDGGAITLASQNTAPVPSGLTYGSTTTTDVGLVDIPTQVFTAHPGATIGQGTPPTPTIQNYSIVGSPTISGTTISGFSASNYLTVSNSTLPSTINSFEIICYLDATNGFKPSGPSGRSDRGVILTPATQWGHAPNIDFRYYDEYYAPACLFVNIPNAQHEMISICSNNEFLADNSNAIGAIKVTYSQSTSKASVYAKGLRQRAGTSDWTLANQHSLPTGFTLGWDDLIAIGNNPNNTTDPRWFPGSVDLNNWSITINGEPWWPFTPWS